MLHQAIVDTGVLVALIDRRDRYHACVTEHLTQIALPLLNCAAVA
ncbi:MAG: PIN domain nuclease [Pseudanabaena sp. SU_2_4]|nr:PIN domain nuclease [Pseudanabaena sp. SU_2_4]